ncbi:MAG: hypothetical protein QXI09_00220 [Candidatus Aenigmatarchaeota archaeon]
MEIEIEKYFLKIDPNKVLSKIVEERVNRAFSILLLIETIIKEKLGKNVESLNLPLLIGNSVKSQDEKDQFLKLLKERGMKEKDLDFIRKLIEEVYFLIG